ncbi:MAG: AraC family transcriptional regulator [Longimicrobiales bacterium]|nr:AraC family transcriptional regulator [Longimicrobiales bacterium]
MRFPVAGHRFLGFFPPYRRLEVLDHPYQIPRSPLPNRGSVLLWNLKAGEIVSGSRSVRARPPGVALFVVLPPTSELGSGEALFRLMELCRPHSVLPYVREIDPEELVSVLRRFPSQLAVEVTEYLLWRGVEVDVDTRRLLRKTLELSGELRTVSGLARALYMSRRALGRRFMTRGLPVPSHWLHFGRILRGSLRLQDPRANLYGVGCELGYPDGFAFSNQMKRLTGLRPSIMRECFGWEWIVESWLFTEAQSGSLSRTLKNQLFPDTGSDAESLVTAVAGSRLPTPAGAMRVAEDGPESA